MSSTFRRSAWNVSKSKFLVSVSAAVMLSACSADSTRLSSNPSNTDPVYTASVPKQVASAPSANDPIASKPLNGSQPPSYDYSQSYKAAPYRQPAVSAAPPAAVPQPETAEAPSAAPGSTVTVGPGMTLYSIARANNMSVSQLAAANGIKPPYSVHTGQMLRIPSGSGAAETASYAEPEAAVPAAPAKPFKQGPSVSNDGPAETHVVAGGETLYSLGRKYGVSPFAIADANGLPNTAQLVTGQKVKIPAGGATAAKQEAAPKLETAEATETAETGTEKVAEVPAPESASASSGEVAETQPAAKPSTAADGATGMRWPVRGKIISGFGPKANGLKNEGINIAVPEGTSIRAAESGVVAYAGNELKGYGNLVLIRHDDGYVTAYAHAKELFVKRGDTVKRGDVIAKAGQTGSVSSPQLHFEVRKGATALDPMKFLSSATASN